MSGMYSSIRLSLNTQSVIETVTFTIVFSVIPTIISHLETPWWAVAGAVNDLKPTDFIEKRGWLLDHLLPEFTRRLLLFRIHLNSLFEKCLSSLISKEISHSGVS